MLLLTVADPLVALWLLVAVTLKLLLLETCKLRVSVLVTLLLDDGPVFVIDALPEPPPGAAAIAAADAALLKLAATLVLPALLALPLIAPPPVVLVELTAEPEAADCEFGRFAVALLLFVITALSTTELLIVLLEFGPVVPMVPV